MPPVPVRPDDRPGPRGPGVTGRGGGPAPPPPPPPAAKKKPPGPPSVSTRAANLFKQFPQWKKYWPTIQNAAQRWGGDPIELLALLIFENGRANPDATSSAGAQGLAQIYDSSVRRDLNPEQYDTFIAEWGELSPERKRDPAYSIHYAAWRMAGSRSKYGSLDEWYRSPGYNPGFKGDSRGPGPSIYVGRYQARPPQTPGQKAGASVEVSGAKQALTDPWVTLVTDGGRIKGVKFKRGDQPPKNVLLFDGLPVTRSQFLQARRQVEDLWIQYTGKRPSDSQVANVLRRGWSEYTITASLSKSKDFLTSPIYKSVAPGYKAAAEGLLGEGEKLDGELVRQAIVNRWSGDVFQANLRARPGYVKSVEFRGKTATFLNVYQQVYGTADPEAMKTAQEAALGGWSLDQYAGWLRSQDAYTSSQEYKSKALNFAEALGLITGSDPVMRPGRDPRDTNPNTVNPAGRLPDDKRIAGQGSVGGGLPTLGVSYA